MYIKLVYGRNAGEVRDISNDVALMLIQQGRATRAFTDDPQPRLQAEAMPAVAVEPATGKKKKGHK